MMFLRFLQLVSAVFITEFSYSQYLPMVRRELEEINVSDQKYRIVLDSLVRKEHLDWQHPEIQKLIPIAARQDSINLARITSLIDRHGWLGIGQVGRKGNETIFLVIQHADSVTMIKYFPMLVKSYELGQSPGKYYAMMLDRILVERGQPQVYGTQMQMADSSGSFKPFPIQEHNGLDKRRKRVGLPAFKKYLSGLNGNNEK